MRISETLLLDSPAVGRCIESVSRVRFSNIKRKPVYYNIPYLCKHGVKTLLFFMHFSCRKTYYKRQKLFLVYTYTHGKRIEVQCTPIRTHCG